jgi:uncharacterized protein
MSTLAEFRKGKDVFFASHPSSPLTPEQKTDFKGLTYFPENPALRIEIEVEPFTVQEQVKMPTSTGEIKTYTRHARFAFEAEGNAAELTLYNSPSGLFLLFVDSLAGTETYGAGRYLEPEELPNDRILVDFNLAYNPYCAYNDMWSCPIPPAENRLDVPIRAGEKNFEAHD